MSIELSKSQIKSVIHNLIKKEECDICQNEVELLGKIFCGECLNFVCSTCNENLNKCAFCRKDKKDDSIIIGKKVQKKEEQHISVETMSDLTLSHCKVIRPRLYTLYVAERIKNVGFIESVIKELLQFKYIQKPTVRNYFMDLSMNDRFITDLICYKYGIPTSNTHDHLMRSAMYSNKLYKSAFGFLTRKSDEETLKDLVEPYIP